jgi:coproporphyrinogen III oxidase
MPCSKEKRKWQLTRRGSSLREFNLLHDPGAKSGEGGVDHAVAPLPDWRLPAS